MSTETDLLDELIPAPTSPARRWLIGACLLVVTIGVGVSWAMGLLVPNPFAGGSWGSGQSIVVDADQRTYFEVQAPNFSERGVRLTDVTIDAPGLQLVEVRAGLEPEPDPSTCLTMESEDGATSTVCTVPVPAAAAPTPVATVGPTPVVGLAVPVPNALPPALRSRRVDVAFGELPVDLPTNGWLIIGLEIDVVDCALASSSADDDGWGQVRATFDFGEGAFLPFDRTLTLDDQLFESPGSISLFFNGPDFPGDEPHIDVASAREAIDLLCSN